MHPFFSTSLQRNHRRSHLFPSHIAKFLLRSILLLSVCIIVPSAARAQGYEDLWKQVDDAARRDLPRTALQLADSIRVFGKISILMLGLPLLSTVVKTIGGFEL